MRRVERQVTGIAYLDLATTLLRSLRRASPTGGIWEAADVQWWWRLDQHRDPASQVFWVENEVAVAALVFTRFGKLAQCDFFCADNLDSQLLAEMWQRASERIKTLSAESVELAIRTDDAEMIELAEDSGFVTDGTKGSTAWMNAAELAPPPLLAPGFTLVDRTQVVDQIHPLVRRNGKEVTARLAECSMYNPKLDLAIHASNGEVATYGLFWADPVTKVGLVEPMRTEDQFQGQGLGSHLIAAGLHRLAGAGCSRLKVSFDPGNEPARRLYTNAGFRTVSETRSYVKSLTTKRRT